MRPFVWLGAVRLLALGVVFVGVLLGLQLVSTTTPLIGVFALLAVYAATFLTKPEWSSDGLLGRLLGPSTTTVRTLRLCSATCFAGYFAGALVLRLALPDWLTALEDRGGAAGIYLTAALLLVALLALSALPGRGLLLVPWVRRSAGTMRRWDHAEGAGGLLIPLLLAYAVAASLTSSNVEPRFLDGEGKVIKPGLPSTALPGHTDQELLAALSPVLAMSHRELRPPRRVDDYLRESSVSDLAGSVVGKGPAELSRRCAGSASPCLVLNNDACPLSKGCRPWTFVDGPPTGVFFDPDLVGYGRLLRRSRDAGVGWDRSPFGSSLQGIAQFWLFAPYDKWSTPMALGLSRVTKQHPADWESVTVGFSADTVLFVAASSHCGGTWRPWASVQVENTRFVSVDHLGRNLHVVLGYGEGSHAMYFEPMDGRAPDSFGCREEDQSGLFSVASYVANLRDRTADDYRLLVTPVPVAEARRVLEFPAYWSPWKEIALDTPFGDLHQRDGSPQAPGGPSSPSSKASYKDPVSTIFCTGTWRGERLSGVLAKRSACSAPR